MNAVSQRLKSFRKDRGLSPTQAAALVPVSRSTWFRWESGIRKIDDPLLPTMIKLTGIPAKELRPDLVEILEREAAE